MLVSGTFPIVNPLANLVFPAAAVRMVVAAELSVIPDREPLARIRFLKVLLLSLKRLNLTLQVLDLLIEVGAIVVRH